MLECPFTVGDGKVQQCRSHCALWDPAAEMCCLRVAARALAKPQLITLVVPRDTDSESMDAYSEDLRTIVENVINERDSVVLDAERKKEERNAGAEHDSSTDKG